MNPSSHSPLLVARLIWGMMLVSMGVYAGLSYALASGFIPFEATNPEDKDLFLMVLGVVAFSSLTASFVVPARLSLPFLNASIIRFAFLEAVGVLGLVYVLTAGDFARALLFFVVGLTGLLLAFPKEEQAH